MSGLMEFLRMGGYAFYVWTSFGLGIIVLALNVMHALQQEKQLLVQLRKRIKSGSDNAS